MFNLPLLLSAVAVISVVAFLFWFFKSGRRSGPTNLRELSQQAVAESIPTIIQVAKEQLEGEKREIRADLANKKEAIEKLVGRLEQDIQQRQAEIRGLEKERNRQFGEVSKSVEEHRKIAEKLYTSTDSLRRVLSNNQLRGEWGERAAEQILENGGLIEGQHYTRQEQLGTGTRPDFVILLPDNRKVCVDAKFPFSELLKLSQTEDEQTRRSLQQQFKTSIKEKIKQVTSRGYISEDEGTLDYVILFVPSEVVFGYINKNFPAIVDEAFSKKVIVASPYSFFAIVRTIHQAHRNFYYEQGIRKIVKVMESFKDDYRRFQDEFGKFGEVLGKLQDNYNQITTTRYNRLDLRFRQIEEYRKGTEKVIPEEINPPSLDV